jgi:hypothetical protein
MGLDSVLQKVGKYAKPVATVAGAAIGGAVGGPAGAIAGAKIGSMVGTGVGTGAKVVDDKKFGKMHGPATGTVPSRASSIEDARGQDRARMSKQYGMSPGGG